MNTDACLLGEFSAYASFSRWYREYLRLCVFALCGVGTILSGFAILSSTLSLTSAFKAFQVYIVVVLVTITLHLLRQVRESINARYALVGIGLLFAAVINDLLHASELIETDYMFRYRSLYLFLSRAD